MRHFLTCQTALALIALMGIALMTACSESTPDTTPTPPSAPAPASTTAPVSPVSTATPASEPVTQAPPAPRQGFAVPKKEPPAIPTLDYALNDIISRIDAGEFTEEQAAEQMPMHRDESVAVTLYISGDSAAVSEYLSDNAISPRHTADDYIELFLPVRMLTEVATLDGIVRIEPIVPPHANRHPLQGATSPADAHGATGWNAGGFTGNGVKVGIIDVGFEGLATLLGSELPATVEARCYRTTTDAPVSLADCDRSDHGTIVAEAVSDIAPEASLYLGGIRTRGDLADVVDWMIDEDVSIINMSLTWGFDGPGDGTSPRANSPLNIVTRATANGILWLNSAGNEGQSSWLGAPTDSDDDGILELDGNEQLTLNSGGAHAVQLRWHGDWNASASDLDIHILDAAGDIVAQSLNPQNAQPGQHPHEIAFAKTTGTVLQITTESQELPPWVQVLAWSASIDETNQSGSIGSPAESADPAMLAVGAANWQRTQTIEGYSSRGPATDGRIKPDLVASACGHATYPSPKRLFCGTSQSSPHAAGMAALVLHAFPDLSNEQVAQYLTDTALDRGDAGPDNIWGTGFAVLPPPPTPSATPTPVSSPTPTPTLTPSPTAIPTPVPNRDRAALEAFYKATDGDNWDDNTNWMSDKPLDQWRGVSLNKQGRVEGLYLIKNLLTGEIPEEIGDLDKLKSLRLQHNNLSGPIPLSIAALTELRTFLFHDNAGICEPPDPELQKWMTGKDRLPTCRDDDQKIVFVSDRDTPEEYQSKPNLEIYVMNSDGTNQTRLTDNLGPDTQPAWSPDGTQIAFVSARDHSPNIYVMDADGSNLTRLTDMPDANHLPTWSPDGQHIAFITHQPNTHRKKLHDIHVMKADGSNLTTVTTEATNETLIAWSPDSERLAYVTWTQNPETYRETETLFTINRDGTNPTQVYQTNRSIRRIIFPMWIPGGDHLSLTFSGRVLDGDTTVPILRDESVAGCPLHWSPDGKLIALELGGCKQRDNSPSFLYYASIHLANADGTGLQRLTDNESNNFQATFSPANGRPPSIWSKDSKHLLTITNWWPPYYEMYIIKADGSGTFFSP